MCSLPGILLQQTSINPKTCIYIKSVIIYLGFQTWNIFSPPSKNPEKHLLVLPREVICWGFSPRLPKQWSTSHENAWEWLWSTVARNLNESTMKAAESGNRSSPLNPFRLGWKSVATKRKPTAKNYGQRKLQ